MGICPHHCPQGSGGGRTAVFAVIAIVCIAAAPAAEASAAPAVHALKVAAEAVVILAVSLAALAVTYVAARVALRVYRWRAAKALLAATEPPPALVATVKAYALPAAQVKAIEGRVVRSGWDNEATVTGGARSAVPAGGTAENDVDDLHALQVRGTASGVAWPRQGVPGHVPVPAAGRR